MKKFITLLIILSFAGNVLPVFSQPLPGIKLDMREADPIEIPAGTFIPVINAQEISTQYSGEGYKLKFISTNDLFMYDTNIIPENTQFDGYIEKLNEPVVGTNASLKIRINKMTYPDGFEMPIRGYIYTSNNNLIGGGISQPAEWRKMPYYPLRRKGTAVLRIQPGEKRKLGEHTILQSGLDLIIVLTDTLEVTHILTN